MSYSFEVRAASKADAINAVAGELDKVVAGQPVHRADRPASEASASAFVTMLRDEPDMDVCVRMHGSVASDKRGLGSSAVGVNAWLEARR